MPWISFPSRQAALALLACGWLVMPSSVGAQSVRLPGFVRAIATPEPARLGAAAGEPGRAWLLETLGGTVGSAAGFGLTALLADPDACDREDLECLLRDAAVVLGGSAVGSGLGTWGAGRLASTRPSGLGAALGSIAGVAAGLGVGHLLTEELDVASSDGARLIAFAVTHGFVTALGSRIVAALRD